MVPSKGLESYLEGLKLIKGALTEADISRTVRYFAVSPALLLIQLERTGWLAPGQKEAWQTLTVPLSAARYGWSDEHRASRAKSATQQPPMRIVAQAVRAYENNLVGPMRAAELHQEQVRAQEALRLCMHAG